MAEEAIFPKGLMVKDKHPSAPDFIKCKVSIKKDELIEWMQQQESEWLNFDVKRSRDGKLYIQQDTWQPNQDSRPEEKGQDAGADVPF